ncbi:MAG: DUF2339 domain-containing protein, partial [Bacteroidota bacterium]
MSEEQKKVEELQKRLDALIHKQNNFVRELRALRSEVKALKGEETPPVVKTKQISSEEQPVEVKTTPLSSQWTPPSNRQEQKVSRVAMAEPSWLERQFQKIPRTNEGLEQFIGENLISKIGILITVFGVAVGARYAIANNMVSPLTRIVMGYLMGLALIGIAFRLRSKYENFSAVLLSGAMAIFYFITFSAYAFYALIPQLFTFVLMVIFTVFTVIAALSYRRQFIAHLGLVGAYGIPFLLSSGSGDALSLFIYMVLINLGILAISFRQYWKPLLYVAFVFTWLIFTAWYFNSFEVKNDLALGLGFSGLFFAIFYTAVMAYKLIKAEQIGRFDTSLILTNAFLFYGLGYVMLDEHESGAQLLGVFTVVNALIHFGIALLIRRYQLASQNLFHLVAGLVLIFLTLTIPVQLDGVWVTIAWALEASLLFWLSRSRGAVVFERMSYVLMFIAFAGMLFDWSLVYVTKATDFIPLLNVQFLNGILFIAAFSWICWWIFVKDHQAPTPQSKWWYRIVYYAVPSILVMVTYNTFRLEIAQYFDHLYWSSEIKLPDEYPMYKRFEDLQSMKALWLINYTMLFLSLAGLFILKKLKHERLTYGILIVMTLFLVIFAGQGNYELNLLRHHYISQNAAEYYHQGVFHLIIRYVSLAFVFGMLYVMHLLIRQPGLK